MRLTMTVVGLFEKGDVMGKGLSIPLNEKGVSEYDYGVLESENLIFIEFPECEVNDLFNSGTVDIINEQYRLGIDDYESTLIPKDVLGDVISHISESKYPVFYKALKIAAEKGEFLALDL